MTSDRLETVGWVFRPAQLLVVQSLLEQANIPHCLIGYHHITNQWPLALALGGIELRVPEVRAEEARELFASMPPLEPPTQEFGTSLMVRLLVLLVFYCFALVPPPALAAEFVPPRREARGS
jgi:hypothetical protein